jgi:hypothetical protein
MALMTMTVLTTEQKVVKKLLNASIRLESTVFCTV